MCALFRAPLLRCCLRCLVRASLAARPGRSAAGASSGGALSEVLSRPRMHAWAYRTDGRVIFSADQLIASLPNRGLLHHRLEGVHLKAIQALWPRAGRSALLIALYILPASCNNVQRAAARPQDAAPQVERQGHFLSVDAARPGLDRGAAHLSPPAFERARSRLFGCLLAHIAAPPDATASAPSEDARFALVLRRARRQVL